MELKSRFESLAIPCVSVASVGVGGDAGLGGLGEGRHHHQQQEEEEVVQVDGLDGLGGCFELGGLGGLLQKMKDEEKLTHEKMLHWNRVQIGSVLMCSLASQCYEAPFPFDTVRHCAKAKVSMV